MMTRCKTILRVAFTMFLCFGVSSVQALQIVDVHVMKSPAGVVGDPDKNVCLSEIQDELLMGVFFSERLYNFVNDPLYTGTYPQLNFMIDGISKTAELFDIYDDVMYFIYIPRKDDYGTGFTIRNGSLVLMRRIIDWDKNVLNFAQDKSLGKSNQYAEITGFAINSNPENAFIGLNMYRLETDTNPITIARGTSVLRTLRRPDVAWANLTEIDLLSTSTDNTIAKITLSTNTLAAGKAYMTFNVTGMSPGTAVARISSQAHPSEFVEIPITVQLTATDRVIHFDPPQVCVQENEENPRIRVRVSLDIPPKEDVVLNVIKVGVNADRITCASTVTILAGKTFRDFDIFAPDGPVNAELTFSDPSGEYNQEVFEITVENLPPTIVTPLGVFDDAVGVYRVERSVGVGETLTLEALATDSAGTNDVIRYRWEHDGPDIETQTASFIFNRLGVFEIVLTAWDKDGGFSIPVVICVTVHGRELVSFVFTEITSETVSFQIPNSAKSRDFQIEIATEPSFNVGGAKIMSVSEKVGTYSTSNGSFSGKLHGSVIPGSVQLSAGGFYYSDNGNGALVGNIGPAGNGTINYASGAWSFTVNSWLGGTPGSGDITAVYSYTVDIAADWTPWLLIPAIDLAAGGTFSADTLSVPSMSVEVVSADNGDGTTTITFDVGSLYATEPCLFFRVSMQDDPL